MERRRGRRRGIWAIVLLAVGGLLVVGAKTYAAMSAGHPEVAYEKHRIPGESMRPAYTPGDSGWFSMGTADELEIGRGDVVLASMPDWVPDGLLLSRVVARGGDRIEYRPGEGRLRLNGEPLDEPYVLDRSVPSIAPFDVTVPEGHVFLMGDNRVNSIDSSLQQAAGRGPGTVSLSAVRGEAVAAPTGLIVAGGAEASGIVVILAGGVLGVWALVARRRRPAAGSAATAS
ncbi:signal peptidase I [Streptomyces sp. NPDC059564]|uniref:signal peptidase I n=1 Tax=Streptomyces sp. NPDC059564 TaxID=3346865 RepID=UPI00369E7669